VLGFKKSYVEDNIIAREINNEFLRRWKQDIDFKNKIAIMIKTKKDNASSVGPSLRKKIVVDALNFSGNGWNEHCKICSKFLDKEGICSSCRSGTPIMSKFKRFHYWDASLPRESYCGIVKHMDIGFNRVNDWNRVNCKQCLRYKTWADSRKAVIAKAARL
jgi:hypothetical protein